jgi:hypothetical protein
MVNHPEVILLEDQHNSNSNCLVLDVSFLFNSSDTYSESNSIERETEEQHRKGCITQRISYVIWIVVTEDRIQ